MGERRWVRDYWLGWVVALFVVVTVARIVATRDVSAAQACAHALRGDVVSAGA